MIDIGIILFRCTTCNSLYGCETEKDVVVIDRATKTIGRRKIKVIHKCKQGSLQCRFLGVCDNKKYGLDIRHGKCENC